MGFFKKFFRMGESSKDETKFIPSPTQQIAGIPPIVVQAIENMFPNVDDQQRTFANILKIGKRGKPYRDPQILLALLYYTKGDLELYESAIGNFHFMLEEIEPVFPKMKDAEEWVKSITKTLT